MNNVMVDLETLGINNSPVILSIGAVKFDENGLGDEFHLTIDRLSCAHVGLIEDQSTIEWWGKQDPEVFRSACSGTEKIHSALKQFAEWLGPDMKVWGNGACADNVWLRSAYTHCRLPVPWNFWNDRCYRTVKALYPNVPKVVPLIAHDALHDAIAQANTLIEVLKEASISL